MLIRHAIFWGGLACSVTALAQPVKATSTSAEGVCLLADFRALALTTHDPAARLDSAMRWMNQHARHCSVDQLKILSNYRASWLGSSDHPKLQGLIDGLIEAKSSDDPEKLKALFTPEVPPSAEETIKTVTAKPNPRPVIAPPMAPPPMLNPVVQGYIQPPLPAPPAPPARPAPAVPNQGTP